MLAFAMQDQFSSSQTQNVLRAPWAYIIIDGQSFLWITLRVYEHHIFKQLSLLKSRINLLVTFCATTLNVTTARNKQ